MVTKGKPRKPKQQNPRGKSRELPRDFFLTAEASDLEILAAEHEDDEDGKPRIRNFKMRAYSGGFLFLANFFFPVVVDLQGLKIPRSKRPILRDHRLDKVVGHTESIEIQGNKLLVAGLLSGSNDHSKEIVDSADAGFPWQSSIGAKANKLEFVDEGGKAKVNGRTFNGPFHLATKSTLGEVSFVAIGADENDTPARVAAIRRMENTMEFTKWLEAKSIDPDTLTEEVKATLEDAFSEQEKAKIKAEKKEPADDPKPTKVEGEGDSDPLADLRAGMAAEARRVSAVQKLCGDHSEILATAIEENWDVTKTELEVNKIELKALRDNRPAGPGIHDHTDKSINGKALEATMCLSAGMSEKVVGESHDDKTMEAALSSDLRGAGIHALFYEVIRASGGHARPGNFTDSTIKAAFAAERQFHAHGGDFSTISLAGVLSNVANKTLLNAFIAVEAIAPMFSRERDVRDFKVHESFRLTSTGRLEKVAPDGELTHTEVTEEKFQNQLDTYGRILALTRQTIINDDLDAFLDIPRMLGRQGALARERVLFEILLANAGPFFTVGDPNNNAITGASSALQISSLTELEQIFLDQKDSDGQPVLIAPKFLLVPTSLKVTAKQIFTDQFVNEDTTANVPKPSGNPHQGKWDVLSSPFLNSQGLAGSSATAWYFFANPNDVAAIEIAYLNGLRTPTMDTAEMDFNLLGMQWRAFWDFGIAFQDFRGAAKSDGV